MYRAAFLAVTVAAGVASGNLITNGTFEDTNTDGNFGDDWFTFGAAAVNFEFFPNGNPGHGTLFGDNVSNFGGIFQLGIAGTEGTEYEFSIDGQFEAEWDARLRFGLEFYLADDTTKIGEALVEITNDSDLAGTGYNTFVMSAIAPTDTAIIRPIVLFDNVQSGGSQRASTWDNASLVVVPAPATAMIAGLGAVFAVRRHRAS
ncbi:MAG: hypothetical protein AAGB51_00980 [Planctomycetota bacterium]